MHYIGGYMMTDLNITSEAVIGEVIELTSASLIEEIAEIPGIAGVEGAWEAVVYAGQVSFAGHGRCVEGFTDHCCLSAGRIRRSLCVRVLCLHRFWVRKHYRSMLPWRYLEIHGRSHCRSHVSWCYEKRGFRYIMGFDRLTDSARRAKIKIIRVAVSR